MPSASELTCAGIAAFLHPPTAVLLPLSRLLRDDWLNDIKGTRVRRHNVCEDVGVLPNHRHDLVAAVVFQPVYVLQQLPIGGLFAVKAIIGVAFAVADLCPSEQLSQIAKELGAQWRRAVRIVCLQCLKIVLALPSDEVQPPLGRDEALSNLSSGSSPGRGSFERLRFTLKW